MGKVTVVVIKPLMPYGEGGREEMKGSRQKEARIKKNIRKRKTK